MINKANTEPNSIHRLGKPPEDDARSRPTLLTLNSPQERKEILRSASALKRGPKEFQKVFLKKDGEVTMPIAWFVESLTCWYSV